MDYCSRGIDFGSAVISKYSNAYITSYCGYSNCRCCDKTNGDQEYYLISDDDMIIYVFPEGLKHYYISHNVQPSKEFIDFITNFKLYKLDDELRNSLINALNIDNQCNSMERYAL